MEEHTKHTRNFLPADFKVSTWEALEPYFDTLLKAPTDTIEALKVWMARWDELENVVSEDLGWRYIKMTCHTGNPEHTAAYQDFVQNIQPRLAPWVDELNRKLLDSPVVSDLKVEPPYQILLRNIEKEIELFREENIPLFTKIITEAQKYAQVTGAMTVQIDGQELTMQQAGVELLSTDRARREQVWGHMSDRRLADKDTLDELFDKLIAVRCEVANNAGFSNFRDYMFRSYGRFDYTPEDCFTFHDAIATEVVPVLNRMAEKRKQSLQVDVLRPWDKAVDMAGREPLKAFDGGDDLTVKAIKCLEAVDAYFGECVTTMKEMGHLDVVSRKGKAPGGYNYPLLETGVPFIFMNATSTLRDLTTMLHEAGHAIHSFLTHDISLSAFKSPPMEVAELASMSMELLTMDHWDIFFPDEVALKRAKKEQLEGILETLPWVAIIDQFQHWIYVNPSHTPSERRQQWNTSLATFSDKVTNWDGLETARDFLWQKQLHLYEVPFYYIEYGMAQLGAIAIWRNYRNDKKTGLTKYKEALKLGNQATIPEIYQAAGIRFDFSPDYIRELMQFVEAELDTL